MKDKKPSNIIDLDERRYFKKLGVPFFDLENTPLEELEEEARKLGYDPKEYAEEMLAFIDSLKEFYKLIFISLPNPWLEISFRVL